MLRQKGKIKAAIDNNSFYTALTFGRPAIQGTLREIDNCIVEALREDV